jgi:CoA:oxalate CoA-transferase
VALAEVLAGVLVVDLSVTAPGPYCTSLLRRMGARVVKFEPPTGDPARQFARTFEALNRGKESVVVDLSAPEDVALVRSAASRGEVFVEGWRPGVAERRGLGPDALLAENPRLVYCSISGYGAAGPLRDRAGHDLNFVAASGMASLLSRNAEPVPPGAPLADLAGGTFGALAVLAGVIRARATGAGGHYDVSMAGALRDWVDSIGGAETVVSRNPLDDVPHYGIFATADGHHLSLAVVYETSLWEGLCDALGLDDVRGLTFPERVALPELRSRIAEVIGARQRAQLEADLARVNTCWAFVDPPGLSAVEAFLPPRPEPSPSLGEHTDAVRAELSATRPG